MLCVVNYAAEWMFNIKLSISLMLFSFCLRNLFILTGVIVSYTANFHGMSAGKMTGILGKLF